MVMVSEDDDPSISSSAISDYTQNTYFTNIQNYLEHIKKMYNINAFGKMHNIWKKKDAKSVCCLSVSWNSFIYLEKNLRYLRVIILYNIKKKWHTFTRLFNVDDHNNVIYVV